MDTKLETDHITNFLKTSTYKTLRKKGAVVGISGGIDSSVVVALCARALGPENVLGILLPERESSPESKELALRLAKKLKIQTIEEDITGILEGAGCYERRNEALSRLFPGFGEGWKAKIAISGNLLEEGTLNIFQAVVKDPDGNSFQKRIPLKEFMQVVAASNFKQRSRMMMLYYHAEVRNYVVAGTPNKNETELGFFVKYGDGAMDINPIGHLFKTQVFQLAEYLEIPWEIRERTPTTDTYPGGSTQEEFFYRIPFDLLDAIWMGTDAGFSIIEIADELNLPAFQVQRVVLDIKAKKQSTQYLRSHIIDINDMS
ncbi:MAG: NAD(+) synthase [Bacteroidales bacterium]|nr:NAD(+) synthase [Bacteroidales bacterium]